MNDSQSLDLNDVEPQEDITDVYEKQQQLILEIDEYLITHPVDGKKMTLKDFAQKSELSMSALTAIFNGRRWIGNCNRSTVKKLAAALELPVLQIYILSGFIEPADIVFAESMESRTDFVYTRMRKDKSSSFQVPSRAVWDSWPMSAKVSMCMMYESLSLRAFMNYNKKPEPVKV